MHTSSHTVLYDPDGLIEAELPLDREPYECLVKAILTWTGEDTLAVRDYEQIGLQLTGHARAVASAVRRCADQLPKSSGPRALADVVLRDAEGRLSAPLEGTVRCVQNRARLVRSLYARLDRLEAALAPDRQAPTVG
ncbi:restriction endonuclease [Streptomyces niveus]|uniref:restriction endonuclease n=1 Tax=Streptomyces niveus TaxID=193462 RepID=UPI003426C21E